MSEASGRLKSKVSYPVAYLRTVINYNEETKHDKLDKLITKIFPYFAVICVVFSCALFLFFKDYTLAGALLAVCIGFVTGFVVLGLVCVFLSDNGVIPAKIVFPTMLILPAAAAVIMYYLGTDFGFNQYIMKYFDIFIKDHEFASLLISLYTIVLMIFLAGYGVVSVIVGYFRTYFYRVLRALERPPEERKNRIPERLFQIPNIIDIKTVEFEPEVDDDKFNVKLFLNTALSLFVLGLVICSYFFINPLFIQTIHFDEMLLLGMLLSLFISPLVIPWSIVKSIGAKVTSDAPRDFYLWKGMRKGLYQGFFSVTFFMMLLALSVFLGMDLSRILTTYLGYVTFMGVMALITSFVYVNTYYKGFKNGIIKSYLRSKEE